MSFRRLALVGLVGLALVAMACGGGGDKPEPTPTATPETPGSTPALQTIALYVQNTMGKTFVEDCTAGGDAGSICAVAKGQRDNLQAFQLGPAGGRATQWAIVEDRGGGQLAVTQVINITGDNASVPGIPWPLRTGVDLVVAGSAPCVNVREGPSLNNKAVDCINDGTKVRLIAGPVPSDNFQFWQVEGRSGWVVADYLRYPDAAQ